MSFLSDYTEKNSNLIPQIDIPCFAWNSQAEQGFLFFKAKSLTISYKTEKYICSVPDRKGENQYCYYQYSYIVLLTVLELSKAQFWNCQKYNSRIVPPKE